VSSTRPEIYYDPFDVDIDRNVHEVCWRMREEQPVYWNDRYEFFALSRFADVWNAYHDTATFSSTHGVMPESLDEPIGLPLVIFMDPPEHDWMRKLVSRAFTPRRVDELEAHVVELVDRYLDRFVGSSGFDYVEQFGALLPPMVIGHMLGIDADDRDMVRRWFDDMLHHEDGNPAPSAKAAAAMQALHDYITATAAERRQRPRDDMFGVLIDGEVNDGERTRRLTEFEIVSFVTLLAGAGVETVARLLSWAALTLAENPDQRRLLVDDPALIPNAVEELLRYEAPSPVNGRFTLRPYVAHGIEIPAGSKVLLLNGSANRDRREFDEPDCFDVRRDAKRHISFGYGAHFCLGAALARMEARNALAGTLARFPRWEVDPTELVRVQTSTVRGFSSVPIHLD
jgi:cytochrome P450